VATLTEPRGAALVALWRRRCVVRALVAMNHLTSADLVLQAITGQWNGAGAGLKGNRAQEQAIGRAAAIAERS